MGARRDVVVLDTNDLVSALGWRGPEYHVYKRCESGHAQMAISSILLDELNRVLQYPKFGFTAEDIDHFESDITDHATVVRPDREVEEVVRDPDDNRVLECAVAADADWIISGDRDLLDVGEYGETEIIAARTAVRRFGVD